MAEADFEFDGDSVWVGDKASFLERMGLRRDRRREAREKLAEEQAEYARRVAERSEAWQREAERLRTMQAEFLATARAAHVTVAPDQIPDSPPPDFLPLPAAPLDAVTVIPGDELWPTPIVAMNRPSEPKEVVIPAVDVPDFWRGNR